MFQGFSEETIKFLYGLKENNRKDWFEENRDNYKENLLLPFQELVKDLSPYMLEMDAYIETNPKRCISRINRDIRFSKDKSPYRPNMWLSFKRLYRDWKIEPTYFFEIFPDFYRYGMGFYNTPKDLMDELRKMILEKNKEFMKIQTLFKSQNTFAIDGEKYKRILDSSLSPELADWYQRKEIYFVCNKNIDSALFSKELVNELVNGFTLLAPSYDFFMKLRDKYVLK